MADYGKTGGPQLNLSSPDGNTDKSFGINDSGDVEINSQIIRPLQQVTNDPGSPQNGDSWYNTTLKRFKSREDDSTVVMDASYNHVVLTDGANIAWDADLGSGAEITLGGNRTLDNITNLQAGRYCLIVKQDATGSRTLSYGSLYKFPAGSSPTLTTTANAVDVLTFTSCGVAIWFTGIEKDLS